ncbi:MAG: hypothetical protein B6I24_00580 [Bacteroidetes bacterium 4572_128]|nr:MAG: hypothetical protein B6I24_00580 [Bacteroidetes bacterium 4572_128]
MKTNFKKTNFNENYAEILVDNNNKILKLIWKGFVNFEEYKYIFDNAYQIFKKNKLKFWISDMTNGKAVPSKAQEWLRNIYIPKIVAIGLIKVVFIVEKNIFRKVYSDYIKEIINLNGVELMYYKCL